MISSSFSVCAQVMPDDMARLKTEGFRAIICNRPDREEADQPSFGEIAAAARKAGIEARYVPVQPGTITVENREAFASALDDLPRPLVAYCRTGTRSAMLWSLHEAKNDT